MLKLLSILNLVLACERSQDGKRFMLQEMLICCSYPEFDEKSLVQRSQRASLSYTCGRALVGRLSTALLCCAYVVLFGGTLFSKTLKCQERGFLYDFLEDCGTYNREGVYSSSSWYDPAMGDIPLGKNNEMVPSSCRVHHQLLKGEELTHSHWTTTQEGEQDYPRSNPPSSVWKLLFNSEYVCFFLFIDFFAE